LGPPSKPAPGINQSAYLVAKASKPALLEALLDDLGDHTTLVFTRTKHGADRLARRLKSSRHPVAPLHGDRSQGQRERALRDFKTGRIRVLVATDIASRGIDVDDVTHVINFDVPRGAEDYVHRIGRTGRMDATGEAITLVSPEESKDFAAIESELGKKVVRRTLAGFESRSRGVEAPSHEPGDGRRPRGSVRSRRTNGHDAGPDRRGAGDRGRASDSGGATAHVAPVQASRQPTTAAHGRRPRPGISDRRSRRRM
jgi:ATP-dependent RNA helicase RhlE